MKNKEIDLYIKFLEENIFKLRCACNRFTESCKVCQNKNCEDKQYVNSYSVLNCLGRRILGYI